MKFHPILESSLVGFASFPSYYFEFVGQEAGPCLIKRLRRYAPHASGGTSDFSLWETAGVRAALCPRISRYEAGREVSHQRQSLG